MDFGSQDSKNTAVPVVCLKIRNSLRLNRARRIEWLVAHRQLWRGFPNSHKIDDQQVQERWKNVVMLMRSEGLVSRSTHWRDVNLINLVADARKAIRDRIRCSAPDRKKTH